MVWYTVDQIYNTMTFVVHIHIVLSITHRDVFSSKTYVVAFILNNFAHILSCYV